MKRLLSKKWLVILLTFVALVVFDSMHTQTSIVSRAIVIGFSIDREEDDLELSAQVILPRNGGIAEGGNDFATFSAKGKTIEAAIRALDVQVGAKMSFAHAAVVVLGDDFLKSDHIDVLRFLIESDIVSDNMDLVASSEKGKDLLSAKMAMNENASYHLQRLLQSDVKQMGINAVNIKEYFMAYYRVGSACFLPIATKKETEKPNETGSSGSEEEKYYLIDLNRTAIFRQGNYTGTLGETLASGLGLVTYNLTGGIVPYTDDQGKPSQAQLVKSSYEHFYDPKTDTMHLEVSVTLHSGKAAFEDNGEIKIAFSQSERERIAEQLKKSITDCYRYAKLNNTDLMGVGESVYAATGNASKAAEALDSVPVEVSVKLKVE